jgi:putative transposase
VKSLKGASARLLRHEFTGTMNRPGMHGHLWSPSYFAASSAGAPMTTIQQYIQQTTPPA